MKPYDLCRALEPYGIKLRSSIRRSDGKFVRTFEGTLPEFPFRSRLESYDLIVAGEGDFIERDKIEALLLHFYQGQAELFTSN